MIETVTLLSLCCTVTVKKIEADTSDTQEQRSIENRPGMSNENTQTTTTTTTQTTTTTTTTSPSARHRCYDFLLSCSKRQSSLEEETVEASIEDSNSVRCSSSFSIVIKIPSRTQQKQYHRDSLENYRIRSSRRYPNPVRIFSVHGR